MRIFVYEHLCAVGSHGNPSLAAEGWAMLAAALADFARVPGAEVFTLLHDSRAVPAGVAVRRTAAEDEAPAFRDLARACDYTLVIAPECGGLLEERCRWVEEAGGRLLGPSRGAVRVTADKLALAALLDAAGVPTPPAAPVGAGLPASLFPAVCKPRDGAGSQATFLVRRAEDLPACVAAARAEGWDGELLVQRFAPGRAASVAFLVGPAARVALAPAAQDLSADGRFHYRGGSLPLPPADASRAVGLASRAVEAVPGLAGYVGVDLVLGGADDGREDCVIEVNPRLTTSYVGLRALAGENLAAALLRVVRGEAVPAVAWRPGAVAFRADGEVRWTA